MDTPTPKLLLPQFTDADPMDFEIVNQSFLDIENKLTVSAFTTATRPTGVQRYDGRIILDTDLNQYLKWNAAAGAWQLLAINAAESQSISNSIANGTGVTVNGVNFAQRNGMAQLYISWSRTTAIADGDIGNFNVCLMPAPWRPAIPTVLLGGASGPPCVYYFSTSGQISMSGTAGAISAGFDLNFGGTYILAN